MASYKDAKLNTLLELAEFDPNLLLLAAVLGSKTFGKLLKTFPGMTIKFPDIEDVKHIAKKVGLYRSSFKRIVKEQGKNTKIGHLAEIGLLLDQPDVRKAFKAKLDFIIFQEYIRSIYEDETYQMTMEELEEVDTQDKIEMYRLHIRELSKRTSMFKYLSELKKPEKTGL